MTEVLSQRALNRAYLARQHLLERSTAHTPAQMLEHLVGMQAQVPMAPYTGLWTRIEGFDPHVLAADLEARRVVRMGLMRATVHMVTARDALTLLPLTQPMHDRVLQGSFAKRLAGLDKQAVVRQVTEATTREPLTPKEIARHLQPLWPEHDEEILGIAGSMWCGLTQVPPRGVWGRSGQARVTPLAHWLRGADAADRSEGPEAEAEAALGAEADAAQGAEAHAARGAGAEAALGAIFLRYLGACGPASVADFRAWSRLTHVDAAVERVAERLVRFADERGRTLLDLPDAPRPDPETKAPPRILPILDNLLLSHDDRTRVIAPEHRDPTFNGTAFLVDGVVAGTHRLTTKGQQATLTFTALRRITKRDTARLEREALRLLAFLEPERGHAVAWSDS